MFTRRNVLTLFATAPVAYAVATPAFAREAEIYNEGGVAIDGSDESRLVVGLAWRCSSKKQIHVRLQKGFHFVREKSLMCWMTLGIFLLGSWMQ